MLGFGVSSTYRETRFPYLLLVATSLRTRCRWAVRTPDLPFRPMRTDAHYSIAPDTQGLAGRIRGEDE